MIAALAGVIFALQGSGTPDWIRMAPRPSETIRKKDANKGEESRKRAVDSRRSARERNHDRYLAINAAAEREKAKSDVEEGTKRSAKLVRVSRNVIDYAAEVTIPIRRKNETPIVGLPVLALVSENHQDPRIVRFKTNEAGTFPERVALPAKIVLQLDGDLNEWAMDMAEGEGEVFSFPAPKGKPDPKLFAARREPVGKPEIKKASQKGVTTETTITRYVQPLRYAADRPVYLRRKVADFRLPKEKLPEGMRSFWPTVWLGDERLTVTETSDAWMIQGDRDALPDKGGVRFVVEYNSPHARYAGELHADQVGMDETIDINPSKPVFDSIPEGAIVLAGHSVGPDFRLSPMQWSGEENSPAIPVTGLAALNLLETPNVLKIYSSRPPDVVNWIQRPGPSVGRYGQWLWLGDKGLGVHCRWEANDKLANTRTPGQKRLPGNRDLGLVESIRVVTPAGGSIGGVLQVGAEQQAVIQAFGPLDTPEYDQAKALFAGTEHHESAVTGDPRIEMWDDSVLDGGIRLKWENGRVKWFEIARPIELLYNGTRPFQPPAARRICVRSATVKGHANAHAMARARIEDLIGQASGVVLTSDPQACDYLLDAEFTTPRQAAPTKIDQGSSFELQIHRADGKPADKPIQRLFKPGRDQGHEFCDALAVLSDMFGTVVGVNYETGKVLINLGRRNGILDKKNDEGTEFALYLLYEVDQRTGYGPSQDKLENEALLGPKSQEWLEVESVGENSCIAKLVKKNGGKTVTAYDAISRLIDPGSGLLRVRIMAKRG